VLQDRVYQQPVRDVKELKRRLTDSCQASTRQSFKQMIIGELGWRNAFGSEADIFNICCNVLAVCCLSALFAATFHLNVPDDNNGIQAYVT